MSTSKLESLPQELIAHIATFVEALSIIHLSRTSKTIRSACYNSLTFKEILQRSQRLNWRHISLKLEAIARHAKDDVAIWARYAVADDQAWILAGMKEPLTSRRRSINFLPELAVVKHPFLKQRCWSTATHGPFDYLASHVFSLAMAVLSADDTTLTNFHDPGDCEYCYPKPRENDPAFLSGEGSLWTLCSIAITVRTALKTRRSIWPYNEAANVPYIDCPRADRVPLKPLNEAYGLPVPFSHRAEQLLSRWIPHSGGWDDWYRQHNHALYSSSSFFTSGSWCGYYTYADAYFPVDPPMTRVCFQRERGPSSSPGEGKCRIRADNCVDGAGNFSLRGTLGWDGSVATLTASKQYRAGQIWGWDCRLTPFGVVGHWGVPRPGQFETHGYVWLWKEEWMSKAGG